MLHPLLRDARAVLLDLDGTVYSAEGLLPGAKQAIETLRSHDIPVRFITNSTMRPRHRLVQNLQSLSVPCSASDILNPATAAVAWLRSQHPDAAVFLLVTAAARVEFAEIPKDELVARFVVIGDMGDEWTFAGLNHAFRLMHEGAGLVALGKSRYWRAGDGLQLDVGPFVTALEYATGHEAIVIGKPQAGFYAQALTGLEVSPEQVVMVGDDIDTDIGGAQRAGYRTLLVQTGKFSRPDLQKGIWPDALIASIAELASP